MSPQKFCIAFFILFGFLLSACSVQATPTVTLATLTPKIAHTVTEIPAPTKENAPTQVPSTATQISVVVTNPTVTEESVIAKVSATPQAGKTKSPRKAHPTPTSVGFEWGILPTRSQWNGLPFEAIYQEFENGYMLWRSDLNCVYAIKVDVVMAPPLGSENVGRVYCLTVAPLSDKAVTTIPPTGQFFPEGALGKVWKYYPEIQQALGYATQPEIHYTATLPPIQPWDGSGNGPFFFPLITLPGERILQCAARGGRLGRCWSES